MKSTNLFRRIYLWHIDHLRKPAWILVAVAVVVNAAAHSFDIWTKIVWSDIVIHMFTTFAVTLLLASYLSHLVRASSRRRLIILLVVLTSLGFSLGGVWEMLEWTVPEKTNGEGRTDVVSDLLCDLIGALAASSVATFMAHRRRR